MKIRSNCKKLLARFVWRLGITCLPLVNLLAQPGGGGTGSGGPSAAGTSNLHGNYHVGFERPEAWGLKYFASTTLLNGLQPPESAEEHRAGSIGVALELGWLPTLDDGQRRIGFNGKKIEDLNKSQILARPVVRIGLPNRFTALVAGPLPFEVFGLTPRLLAFGLERPLVERDSWTVNWRGYGQVGWVKGAFTCPHSVLAFSPGSPANPSACVGESDDKSTLRYAGMEFQVARSIRRLPKLSPHVAVAGNFIDGVFQVHAPIQAGLDQTRLWTRGGTFSTSGGVSYRVSKRAAFIVDAFYTPLWVKRSATTPRTNDGLFNVRALLSYTFR